MNYSKQTRILASELAHHYATFDTTIKQYIINLSDLADFDRHELAASMMSEDDSLSSEATGLDNPAYTEKMLPALLHFMQNSTDKDEEIEFAREWKEGVTSYFTNHMQELLDEYVYNMNDEQGFLHDEDTGGKRDAGQEYRSWY